jgi:Undecaprenyl-phosphate glucose phosphotransferase
VSENSFNSPVFLDLKHGSFYDLGGELLSEAETAQPRLRAKAPLECFVALTLIADFFLLMAAFSYSFQISTGLHSKTIDVFAATFDSLLLTMLTQSIFYFCKLYRIENIAKFGLFCARFFVLLAIFLSAASVYFRLVVSPHSLTAVDRAFFEVGFIAIIALLAIHYAISVAFSLLVAQGRISHDVVVVGTSSIADKFIKLISANGLGGRVQAVFQDDRAPGSENQLSGIPVRGDIAALLKYSKHHAIDTVVVASPSRDVDYLHAIVEQLSVQPLRIRIVPSSVIDAKFANGSAFGWCAPPGELPGVNLIRLVDRPVDGLGFLVKSSLDILVACFAILLFGPLMLICVAGIKLTSPGPILFKQRRIGYRNKEFDVFKFRTMHQSDCNTGRLTVRNDPRIFKFGEILRKFSFDELPQLFNVLKGDMSLVGPRPHMPEAKAAGVLYFNAVPNYAARHRVKPGITGWAQINGWRGPTETIKQIENRVEHDLYYVENWSLALDLKILFKTIFVGFFGDNAF